MGSFLGSAAGAVAGGVASIIGGALSNSAARHAATVANQRNIYNYQHRYQWAMDDMQKAGLNPMLAATQGIGGSINGASALSANYNIGEGVTAGMSASAAGSSAKAANRQASIAEKMSDEQIKNLAAQTILASSSAKKYDAETYGVSLANRLAAESYNDNLALVKQNLLNAQKQGAYIDSQRASQEYLMNVVMPAQAAMMYAQGNAANSSASYNYQLSLQSKEATSRASMQNEMRGKYGFDTDSSIAGAIGGAFGKLLDKAKKIYLGG